MAKTLTLPDVQTATCEAIQTCYGQLLTDDMRWTMNLPQYTTEEPKKRKGKPITLVYSLSAPRIRKGA